MVLYSAHHRIRFSIQHTVKEQFGLLHTIANKLNIFSSKVDEKTILPFGLTCHLPLHAHLLHPASLPLRPLLLLACFASAGQPREDVAATFAPARPRRGGVSPRLALVEGGPATLRLVGGGSSHQRRRQHRGTRRLLRAERIQLRRWPGRLQFWRLQWWNVGFGRHARDLRRQQRTHHRTRQLGSGPGFHMIRRRPSAPKSKHGREKAKIRHFGCS